mmetsp:Transcript_102621/g.187400  ORF Transcript_102621/g.187400 Transcript_102621/m.187400 type:complete len:246 (+) Transcript_102621:1487-2224(+)
MAKRRIRRFLPVGILACPSTVIRMSLTATRRASVSVGTMIIMTMMTMTMMIVGMMTVVALMIMAAMMTVRTSTPRSSMMNLTTATLAFLRRRTLTLWGFLAVMILIVSLSSGKLSLPDRHLSGKDDIAESRRAALLEKQRPRRRGCIAHDFRQLLLNLKLQLPEHFKFPQHPKNLGSQLSHPCFSHLGGKHVVKISLFNGEKIAVLLARDGCIPRLLLDQGALAKEHASPKICHLRPHCFIDRRG